MVESLTKRWVLNGPGEFRVSPFDKVHKRKGLTLGPTEYVRVRHRVTGEIRNEIGPKLLFLGAQEEVSEKQLALTLKRYQYVKIIDARSGRIRVMRGEALVYLEPTEELLGKVAEGVVVDEQNAALVRDTTSGKLVLITEPQIFMPTATQEIVETRKRLPLKRHQYVKILDKSTGAIRVERGEQSILLQPNEQLLTNVSEGISVDEATAVLVRDTTTGQLALITEPQVFIPQAHQDVVETRARIKLEDHQTVIVKDREGRYHFKRGTDAERSFFLEPYCDLLMLCWSTGLHKDQKQLMLTHFDSRPKFMWYAFDVRTQDNVELVIDVTFFWQIVDIEAMIKHTDDTPGDICAHARSTITQSVSQVSLEKFLNEFNPIVRRAVIEANDPFYAERGVVLHSVEVRAVSCKDPATQRILQEIIQETTNRINRLQKQESENEIKLKQLQGDIQAEEQRGQLLTIQRTHTRAEGLMHGEAEALRVRAFFEGLNGTLPVPEKVALFNILRKQEALEILSKGKAQLYFTPNDVNLSIETSKG